MSESQLTKGEIAVCRALGVDHEEFLKQKQNDHFEGLEQEREIVCPLEIGMACGIDYRQIGQENQQ